MMQEQTVWSTKQAYGWWRLPHFGRLGHPWRNV